MIFKTVIPLFFCGLAFSFELAKLDQDLNKQNTTLGASIKQFIVSSEKVNFFRAIINCKQAGMELASITNNQEQSNLEYVLRDVNMTGAYLTGLWLAGTNLVDRSSTQYFWLIEGKTALYTNWCSGEPNNAGGVENCLQIVDTGSKHLCWNDTPCEKVLRYVCSYQNGLWLAGTNLVDHSSTQYYWLLEGKTALYTNWCPGEPNNSGGSENCLQVEDIGSNHLCWNDYSCEIALRYVCQSY